MAGTFQMLKNNRARLQYMCNGERFSTTVEASTPRQAQKKLAQFVVQVEKGEFINTDYTLAEFAQIWFDKHVKKECSPTVIRSYKTYLNNRILPHLGNYKIKNINTRVLKDFFLDMKKWKTNYNNRKTNNFIAKETYMKLYRIVSSILQTAYEWELINNNPCKRITIKSLKLENLPSELEKLKNAKTQKIRAYNIATYKKVLTTLNNINANNFNDLDRIKMIATETALQTGFGISELAGLKWQRDYNSEKSTLSIHTINVYIKKEGWVEKETKVPSRRRTVAIPQSLNKILSRMRQYYKNNEYIFFDLINFNSYTDWLKQWQINNNISPVLTAHELRHTHATILLQLGTDVKSISKRLGHSNTKITLDTYVEYLPENDSVIANSLEYTQ